MSRVLKVPDDVYDTLEQYASETGESIEALVGAWAHELSERLKRARSRRNHPLNWQTATAEDIIADLKASRIEQDCDADQ